MGILAPRSVTLPMSGINESIDSKQQDIGNTYSLVNLTSKKQKRLETRNGFTEVSSSGIVGPKGLWSTGGSIVSVSNDTVKILDGLSGDWVDCGLVADTSTEVAQIFSGLSSFFQTASAENSGFVAYAATASEGPTNAGFFTSSKGIFRVYSDGLLVAENLLAADTSRVHVVAAGNYFFFFHVNGAIFEAATPTQKTLFVTRFDLSTKAFGIAQVLVSDLLIYVDTAGRLRRTYDVCQSASGGFILAYCKFASGAPNYGADLVLKRYTSAFVVSASSSKTGVIYHNVALCRHQGTVYVVECHNNLTELTGVTSLHGHIVDESSLAYQDTVPITNVTDLVTDIGISYDSVNRQAYIQYNTQSDIATGLGDLFAVAFSVDYLTLGPTMSRKNASWRSRFFYSANAPCADAVLLNNPGFSANVGADEAAVLSCGVLLRVRNSGLKIAGIHGVGVSVFGERAGATHASESASAHLGSLPVHHEESDIVCIPAIYREYSLHGYATKYRAVILRITTNTNPVAVRPYQNTLILSGSYITWVSGRSAEELGFVSGVKIEDTQITFEAPVGSKLPVGMTYNYIAQYEYRDPGGFSHRSVSGPYVAEVLPPLPDTFNVITVSFREFNTTYKDGYFISLYRENEDGIYRKITRPTEGIVAPTTYKDANPAKEGEVLAATSGELEPVIPESASVVALSGNRVWLGGSTQGEFVYYSKVLGAGSATRRTAPEMNDALRLTIPGGERCTAIGSLSDKTVVFTRSKTYIIAGRGPDDAGQNDDFSGLVPLQSGVGCTNPRSVVSYPEGLFFQNDRGLFHLSVSTNSVTYDGAPVEDSLRLYPVITSAVVVPKANQIRWTCTNEAGTEGVILVFDYVQRLWLGRWELKTSRGTRYACAGACLHDGEYYVLSTNGVLYKEDTSTYVDDGSEFIPWSLETVWVQPEGQSGYSRLWDVIPFMEVTGGGGVKTSLAFDGQGYTEDHSWDSADISTLPKLPWVHLRKHVRQQKNTAFRVKVESVAGMRPGGWAAISGIRCDFGVKKGHVKLALANRS